ncbi:MAG: hypothetical protein GY756_26940 [bacterium]|nr:hypothetical protein [bacterium]
MFSYCSKYDNPYCLEFSNASGSVKCSECWDGMDGFEKWFEKETGIIQGDPLPSGFNMCDYIN